MIDEYKACESPDYINWGTKQEGATSDSLAHGNTSRDTESEAAPYGAAMTKKGSEVFAETKC